MNVIQRSNLSQELEKQLKSKNIEQCVNILNDNRHKTALQESCADEIHVLLKFLTQEIFEEHNDFYFRCEEILKLICNLSNEDDIVFALLEVIENTKSDNIFISALKGLQIAIVKEKPKSRALTLCLESVYSYITKLQFPEKLRNYCEDEEGKLIENDDNIERIIQLYLILFHFLEPLCEEEHQMTNYFKNTAPKLRLNVILSFLFKLLGPPFAYFEINHKNINGKTYSYQCAKSIVDFISKFLFDPFYLLHYIENRRLKNKRNTKNVFDSEENIPMLSICIYYYLIISQNLLPKNAPKVYSIFYIFENCLQISNKLLQEHENTLIYKGIILAEGAIDLLKNHTLLFNQVSRDINCDFISELMNVIVYCDVKRNRMKGLEVLRSYILKFDNPGKIFNIKLILNKKEWKVSHGYFSILYKDLIHESIKNKIPIDSKEIEFENIFMRLICELEKGPATDLMENSEKIISTLNILRYLALCDHENQTKFWDYKTKIKTNFLSPLSEAIKLSRAHYKLEENKIKETREDNEIPDIELSVNDYTPKITNEEKLMSLASAYNTFDIMNSLLARVNECIERKF